MGAILEARKIAINAAMTKAPARPGPLLSLSEDDMCGIVGGALTRAKGAEDNDAVLALNGEYSLNGEEADDGG